MIWKTLKMFLLLNLAFGSAIGVGVLIAYLASWYAVFGVIWVLAFGFLAYLMALDK